MDAPVFSAYQTVDEVLRSRWETHRVFLDRKTACVGCYLSRFCTLADVAATYRFPVEELLADLEGAAHANQSTLIGAHHEQSD